MGFEEFVEVKEPTSEKSTEPSNYCNNNSHAFALEKKAKARRGEVLWLLLAFRRTKSENAKGVIK